MIEIPGFDLPNRIIDLTASLFSNGGIFKLNYSKFKQFIINNFSVTGERTGRLASCYLGVLPSQLPRAILNHPERWSEGLLKNCLGKNEISSNFASSQHFV
jgi:hypothetical protein